MHNITLQVTSPWKDYELLDSGNGRRLERFGKYVLSRPDPQAIWLPHLDISVWEKADAVFVQREKGEEGEGREKWEVRTNIPEKWEMSWGDVKLYAKLSPFKHTGVFPEQASQWKFLAEQVTSFKSQASSKPYKVLNLFAYTGVASLVAAAAGAEVTHVDSSSSAISWFRENQVLSGLQDKPIRFILEDVSKFVSREVRRKNTYDAVVMDPPIYGHGTRGEVWDFMKDFPELMKNVAKLLSPDASFFLVNAYAISASSLMLGSVMKDYLPKTGIITTGELALQETDSERILSTGIFGLWKK